MVYPYFSGENFPPKIGFSQKMDNLAILNIFFLNFKVVFSISGLLQMVSPIWFLYIMYVCFLKMYEYVHVQSTNMEMLHNGGGFVEKPSSL